MESHPNVHYKAAGSSKGQLISKCSLWYLQFSQKTNEKIRLYYYGIPQGELFSFVFWEKLKTPKRHFKINRPLAGSNQSDRAPSWLSKSIGIVTVRAINLCCQQKKPKTQKV
jgi:hypothetical protein